MEGKRNFLPPDRLLDFARRKSQASIRYFDQGDMTTSDICRTGPVNASPNDPGKGRPGDGGGNSGNDTAIATRTSPKTKKPSMYKVLLLNDDYTPMEFVVRILEAVFHKTGEDATRIMLHVHQKGVGVCGVYTYDIAETKVAQVVDIARRSEHPLQCTMEKE
jgi:ATP-dependent Clp protease adaptor protein ClpS